MSLNIWQKDIDKKSAFFLIVLCCVIFIFYEHILISALSAEVSFKSAQKYLKKARSLSREIIVEKVVLYQKSLRLLEDAKNRDFSNAKYYAEGAWVLVEIGDDAELRALIDLPRHDYTKTEKNEFYEQARLGYAKAVLKEPTNAIFHQRLGSMYERLGEYKEAEDEFERALSLDPHNVTIHLYLCQYYLSQAKNREFQHHLDRVVYLYKTSLWGGGSVGYLADMVRQFLKSIGREELLKR